MKMFCRLNENEMKMFIKQVIEDLEPDKLVTDINFQMSSTWIDGRDNWTVSCSVEMDSKEDVIIDKHKEEVMESKI